MGATCSQEDLVYLLEDGELAPDENTSPYAQHGIPDHVNVYLVLVALDYAGTGKDLRCTKDGKHMMKLWDSCGAPRDNVIKLYNNDATRENVRNAIRKVGKRAKAGDFVIFYYSGHGAQVADEDGDEDDGKDEVLCLMSPDGSPPWFVKPDGNLGLDPNVYMSDDEFSALMIQNIQPEVNLIILCDCCHSGSICDFDRNWGDITACCISGCLDQQTSRDTGHGGSFTNALLMGIESYSAEGNGNYSVGQLYNKTLDFNENSSQSITYSCSRATQVSRTSWPLTPDDYTAPGY